MSRLSAREQAATDRCQRLVAATDRQRAAWQRLQAVRRFPAEDPLIQLRRMTTAEHELTATTEAVRELLPVAC